MPHTFNRAAFASGRNFGSPLLVLYCSLVVIELALKDRKPTWESGHYILQFLNELNVAGLTALTAQLENQLFTLTCTDKGGNSAPVAGDKYPDLRYLRHETDFPGESTDTNIVSSVQITQDILQLLAGAGII